VPNIERDIANEVEWIYSKLATNKVRNELVYKEQQVKFKIDKVLRDFRCEYKDIPFIVKYRKLIYKSELNEEDIWSIFNLDIEYGRF